MKRTTKKSASKKTAKRKATKKVARKKVTKRRNPERVEYLETTIPVYQNDSGESYVKLSDYVKKVPIENKKKLIENIKSLYFKYDEPLSSFVKRYYVNIDQIGNDLPVNIRHKFWIPANELTGIRADETIRLIDVLN